MAHRTKHGARIHRLSAIAIGYSYRTCNSKHGARIHCLSVIAVGYSNRTCRTHCLSAIAVGYSDRTCNSGMSASSPKQRVHHKAKRGFIYSYSTASSEEIQELLNLVGTIDTVVIRQRAAKKEKSYSTASSEERQELLNLVDDSSAIDTVVIREANKEDMEGLKKRSTNHGLPSYSPVHLPERFSIGREYYRQSISVRRSDVKTLLRRNSTGLARPTISYASSLLRGPVNNSAYSTRRASTM